MTKLYFRKMLFLCLLLPMPLLAVERFPRPQFETDHVHPEMEMPVNRAYVTEWADAGVLLVAVLVGAWIVFKLRSRKAMFVLMLLSLAYFGFWKKGCICSVGSLQNVVLALADSTYAIPAFVIAIFAIPLISTLFWGRIFCGGVCPLGAIQDVFVIKPIKFPLWLISLLELFACFYLGLAVLTASLGAGFLICRYDPFVGFFRMGTNVGMLLYGITMLVLAMFVARPYCRFACPYGVLLRWFSILSRKHLTITPTECIQCQLCKDSCPFGAIHTPIPEKSFESKDAGIRRLVLILILAPVLIVSFAWISSQFSTKFAGIHPKVALARQFVAEETNPMLEHTVESDGFRESNQSVSELIAIASATEDKFKKASWLLGAFMGIIVSIKLILLSVWPRNKDFLPDRGRCFSCGRCMEYCPVGRQPVELKKT